MRQAGEGGIVLSSNHRLDQDVDLGLPQFVRQVGGVCGCESFASDLVEKRGGVPVETLGR